MDNLTARIRRFYSAHYPDLDDPSHAASVAEYYVGNDAVLFEALYRKYVAPLRARRTVAVSLQRRWRRRRAERALTALLKRRAAELDGPWVLVSMP